MTHKEVKVGDGEQVTKEDVENERMRWLRNGDWIIVEYDMIHYPGEITQVILILLYLMEGHIFGCWQAPKPS